MKTVSFKVAKAIKKAGYTQDIWKYHWFYKEDGELVNISNTGYYEIPAPTYLEVWLWLWREKKIKFSLEPNDDFAECYNSKNFGYLISKICDDPEDAIISVVEYLVTNDLIK